MKAFEWNKHFVTGIKEVDEQHKKLVDLVNELGNLAIENNLNCESTNKIINELLNYTEYHFKEEQTLMNSFSVDNNHISEHISIHQSFVKEIKYLVTDIKHKPKEYKELFDYLMHWLAYHILGTDQEMARQIELIKSGILPEQAYAIEKDRKSCIAEPLLLALKGLFDQISEKNLKLIDLNRNLENKVKERTNELNELNSHLKILSYTDHLTGLKNRRYALKELAKSWQDSKEKNSELCCMMIDADNFKIINDTHGHDAGDIVIKTLADTLNEAIENPSTVCRLGGDEFICICPETSLQKGIELANKIKILVNKLRVKTGTGVWEGSVSIGISHKTRETKDFEELIKKADLNVYEAKRSGKNCISYSI